MNRRVYAPMTALFLLAVLMVPGQGAVAQRGPGRGGGFGPPAFEDLDKNGNGQVSREEYDEFHQAMRDRRPPVGGPGGPGQPGGPRRERGRDADTSFFKSDPIAKDAAEEKILDVLKDMDQTGRRMQSVPMDDGRFLRLLAESVNALIQDPGLASKYSRAGLDFAKKHGRENYGKLVCTGLGLD